MADLIECFDPFDLKRDIFNRRSREPRSLQEMKNAKYIVLAHFTSSVFLDAIKNQGLIPDTYKTRAIQDYLSSDTECVYLTVKLDRFYIKRALQNHGGEAVVVVVKVELTSLEADENTIPPLRIKNLSRDEMLYESLCFGQCKHRGVIPPSRILGIYNGNGFKIWEPTQENGQAVTSLPLL